ncbi:MAG: hypothetical protein SFT90_01390 [Rickettsiales bacterium]|nr:hypothetical protein [Rickettsiales bacterium]
MQRVTIDILNNNAINLLKELEQLDLIRMREEVSAGKRNLSNKYKGIISPEQASMLNNHINEIRSEWKNI